MGHAPIFKNVVCGFGLAALDNTIPYITPSFPFQALAPLDACACVAIAFRRSTVPWRFWPWPKSFVSNRLNTLRTSGIYCGKYDIRLSSVCKWNNMENIPYFIKITSLKSDELLNCCQLHHKILFYLKRKILKEYIIIHLKSLYSTKTLKVNFVLKLTQIFILW